MSASALVPTTDLDSLLFRGTKSRRALGDAVTEATIDMSIDQVSQLTVSLEDPNFAILNRGLLNNGVNVDYRELRLQVASTETTEGIAGVGGVTVKARPVVVQKLKARRGKLVMKNLSPTQFVQAECKALGIKCWVQPSARRSMISRDIPDKANAGAGGGEPPSSWTTFARLAQELGFLLFEQSGVIYFTSPSYIASRAGRVYASWNYGDPKWRMVKPPTCVRSMDNNGIVNISIEVPASRAQEFRPGRVLVIAGVPYFNGGYLINTVNYSLLQMDQTITVNASTPENRLTNSAVPITKQIAFPTAVTQKVVANNVPLTPVPTITEPRRNTKSRSDFVYWVRESVTGFTVAYSILSRSLKRDGIDGTDLINYGLIQIGLSPQPSFEALRNFCRRGTRLTVEQALYRPGAILFGPDYAAISTQVKTCTIEPNERTYIEVRNNTGTERFVEAWLMPGTVA